MNDTATLRKENKKLIRRAMRNGAGYTKQQIARKTGLSTATCNTLLNEMEADKEVASEKKRLQEVGRASAVFHMNEEYESCLCIWFEIILGVRYLNAYLLSALGTVIEKTEKTAGCLDQYVIQETVRDMFEKKSNIARIMVGTPSLIDGGVIRHCDIPELEGVQLQKTLEDAFQVPVHIENDMSYRIYGYYKKHEKPDSIITLANFPANVLPGTASIHKGEIISGFSGLAGMVGFLPYQFDRKREIELLNNENCLPVIVKAVTSVIVLINPQCIVFTGDLISEKQILEIDKGCRAFIPDEHMPQMSYEPDTNPYYLQGMYEKAMEIGGKW